MVEQTARVAGWLANYGKGRWDERVARLWQKGGKEERREGGRNRREREEGGRSALKTQSGSQKDRRYKRTPLVLLQLRVWPNFKPVKSWSGSHPDQCYSCFARARAWRSDRMAFRCNIQIFLLVVVLKPSLYVTLRNKFSKIFFYYFHIVAVRRPPLELKKERQNLKLKKRLS